MHVCECVYVHTHACMNIHMCVCSCACMSMHACVCVSENSILTGVILPRCGFARKAQHFCCVQEKLIGGWEIEEKVFLERVADPLDFPDAGLTTSLLSSIYF